MTNKTKTTQKAVGRPERLTLRQSRNMLYEKFRTNIRILRASQNLSGVELSQKIGLKSGTRMLELEYGKGTPTMEEIILLSKYFNVKIDDLLDKEAMITFK